MARCQKSVVLVFASLASSSNSRRARVAGTMECGERGKSGERSNNGVTYLLNDLPITFTETPKPQLVVSIGFVRARNARFVQSASKMLRRTLCRRTLLNMSIKSKISREPESQFSNLDSSKSHILRLYDLWKLHLQTVTSYSIHSSILCLRSFQVYLRYRKRGVSSAAWRLKANLMILTTR